MRVKKIRGKKGGLASWMVDIYSIFFYIFVLLVFITLFSLHRGCTETQEASISSELDKGIEARVMLHSILRTPVLVSDGRLLDITELIVLHELPSEDFESLLEVEVTKGVEGYLEQALFDYLEEDYEGSAENSWELNIDYRAGTETMRIGRMQDMGVLWGLIHGRESAEYYEGVKVTVSLPLVYDSTASSQVVEVSLLVHTGMLGLQGDDI